MFISVRLDEEEEKQNKNAQRRCACERDGSETRDEERDGDAGGVMRDRKPKSCREEKAKAEIDG